MRLLVSFALVLLAPVIQAQGLQIHAAVALDIEGDTEGMTRRPVATSPDGFVWVGDVVLDLPPSSIQTVGLETDNAGGTALSLWLSDDAGRAFAELTERSVGQALAVVYQDRVLTAPVVMSPIPNGLVLITGLSEAEAGRLADALRQATAPQPDSYDAAVYDAVEPPPRADPPPLASTVQAPSQQIARPVRPDEGLSVAQSFVDAVAARNWRAVADLMHPEAKRVARASALSILSLDSGTASVRSDGREGSFIASDVIGDASSRRLADLSERDVVTLYLAALDVIGAWGPPGTPRRIVGEVRDGDRVHVILSASGREPGVSDVTLVTLALHDGTWRPLLTQPQGF